MKDDKGKPRLALVPPAIIESVGRARTFGVKKYGDENGWKSVEVHRYFDAFMRHTCAWLRDPHGLDEESGLKHIDHMACNLAFILELAYTSTDADTLKGSV